MNSDVTRGLSQGGENLPEGGPLATVVVHQQTLR